MTMGRPVIYILTAVMTAVSPSRAGGAPIAKERGATHDDAVGVFEPVSPDEEEEDADAQTRAREVNEQAKNFIRQGQEKFEQEDYLGAIELWQSAHDLLPVCEVSLRDELYLYLGSAHRSAYELTKNEKHLRMALEMYSKHRDVLGSKYEYLRTQTEEEIVKIKAELETIEVAKIRVEREQAVREAVAREQENQRRREAQQQLKLQEQRAEIARRLAIDTTIFGAGFIATLGGAVLLAGGTRILGSAIDRRDEQLELLETGDYADELGSRERLEQWYARGRGLAATALVGGTVLTGAGIGLTTWGAARGADERSVGSRSRRVGDATIVGFGLVSVAGGASLIGNGTRMLDTINVRFETQSDMLERDVYPDEGSLLDELERWSRRQRGVAVGSTVGGAGLVGAGVGLTAWGLIRVRRRARSSVRTSFVVPMMSNRVIGLRLTAAF